MIAVANSFSPLLNEVELDIENVRKLKRIVATAKFQSDLGTRDILRFCFA